jgi:hypothetical protein
MNTSILVKIAKLLKVTPQSTLRGTLATLPVKVAMPAVMLVGGVAGTAALTYSISGTTSGFTANIQNDTNTAASGTLLMQEQNVGATVTCLSTTGTGSVIGTNIATCSTINKFGGSTTMVPGTAVVTTATIRNTGTVSAATFTLTPGTCTQSANGPTNGTATDLCAKMQILIQQGTTTVFTGTLATLAGHAAFSLGSLAPSTSSTFTYTVTLDATAGNTYQGLAASLPLTYTFNS